MIGEFGETVLLDWGLAKVKGKPDVRGRALADEIEGLRRSSGVETVAGVPIGTPAYMPPEQARGDVESVDERSDIYSLGAVLYEVLTGRPPHVGPSGLAVLLSVVEEDVPAPAALEAQTPPELGAIAMRALAKETAGRYSSAQELASDLRRFQAGELVRAHQYSAWALVKRWAWRRRYPLLAASVILLAVSAVWWYRGYSERRAGRRAEQLRVARVEKRVQETLAMVASAKLGKNWLDIYAYRLISLKEPAVERLLIRALGHRSPPVRRVAARALGGMGSRRAVIPLCDRLRRQAERSESVVVEVINALGILSDARAEGPVREARERYGQHSFVWKNTDLAYGLIPLPKIRRTQKLSAADWVRRGQGLLEKGREEPAIQAYRNAIRLDPKLAKAYASRASVYRRLGKLEEALADLDAALKLEPSLYPALYNRAVIRKYFGDYDGALRDLSLVVGRRRFRSIGNNQRGSLYYWQGRFDLSIAAYRSALQHAPRNAHSYWGLARALRAKGALANAGKQLDQALTYKPRHLGALLLRAAIREAKGDAAGARAELDQAIAFRPDHRRVLWQRARLRLLAGDASGGRRDLTRALAQPRGPIGLAVLWHYRRGEYEAALAAIEATLSKGKLSGPWADQARIYAFAAAVRAGQPARGVRALAGGAQVGRSRSLTRLVVRFLAGKVDANALENGPHQSPEARVNISFARGLRADAAGNTAAARLHYQAVLAIPYPELLEHQLARQNLRALPNP